MIHEITSNDKIDEVVNQKLRYVRACGPVAVAEAKQLLRYIYHHPDDAQTYAVEKIAQLRVSDEGQEGINAFLEKRKPWWVVG